MKHTIRKTKDEVLYLCDTPRCFGMYQDGTCTMSEPRLCFGTEDGYFATTNDHGYEKHVAFDLFENEQAIGTVKRELPYGLLGQFHDDYSSRTGTEYPILPESEIEPFMDAQRLSLGANGGYTHSPIRLIAEHKRSIFVAIPGEEDKYPQYRPTVGDAILAHGAIAAFVVGVCNDFCFCISAEKLAKDLRRAIGKL